MAHPLIIKSVATYLSRAVMYDDSGLAHRAAEVRMASADRVRENLIYTSPISWPFAFPPVLPDRASGPRAVGASHVLVLPGLNAPNYVVN